MIGEPPSKAGAAKETWILPAEPLAVTPVGAPGTVIGVTVAVLGSGVTVLLPSWLAGTSTIPEVPLPDQAMV